MTQYIDKSALVAEIEKKRNVYISEPSKYKVLSRILSFINTLEVKEVNSTDTFIEKACKWLKENFQFDEAGYCKTNIYSTDSMIYNFEKYIKR